MYTYLFVAALIVIVLLALNFDFLLLPNLAAAGLAAVLITAGVVISMSGGVRRRPNVDGKVDATSDADKTWVRTRERSRVAGSLYTMAGIGILILQTIGFLAAR
jgi:hypothetical protein